MRCQGNSIEFPLTLGREFCGILVQKGMNVDIPLGQRVWGVLPVQNTNGTHAEYVAVTNHCVGFIIQILWQSTYQSMLISYSFLQLPKILVMKKQPQCYMPVLQLGRVSMLLPI